MAFQVPQGPYQSPYQIPQGSPGGLGFFGGQSQPGGGGGSYAWQQKMLGPMGSGNSFGVGWGNPGGQQMSMGVPIGGDPNAGWGAALKGAYDQSQASYDQGLKALGNSFSQGPFGQGLSNMFSNPKGISDEAYSGFLRQIRDREAGSRGGQLESLTNAANASGFGSSMGLLDSQAGVRGRSVQNLNNAELDLLMAREQAKQGQQSMSGSLLAQLYGIDAAQAQSLAQLLANRSFSAFQPEQQYQGTPGVPYGSPWSLPGGGM